MNSKGKQTKTAEEILAVADIKELEHDVKEWDATLTLRAISKGRHQAIRRASVQDGKLDIDKYEMAMLRHGIMTPQFSDEQIEQLREKSASAIEGILGALIKLNGLTPELQKETDKSFF